MQLDTISFFGTAVISISLNNAKVCERSVQSFSEVQTQVSSLINYLFFGKNCKVTLLESRFGMCVVL